MSDREKCAALLDSVPEYKLGYVLAYLQGLTADETDEMPNAATIAALVEGDEMLKSGTGQHFQGTAEEFFALLDAEEADDADN